MASLDSHHEIANTVSELAHLLVADEDLETTLERLSALCCETIPSCDIATVTLQVDGDLVTIASTDELGVAIDVAQYQSGAGPCVEAATTGNTLNAPDLWIEHRWPAFRDAAVARGFKSCASSPLLGQQGSVGSLNLYSRRAHALGPAVATAVSMFAAHATVAVVADEMRTKAAELARQMHEALTSRATIDQAKGILMARHRCGPDGAFDHLRRMSQDENRKLRDVAAELVARTGTAESDGRTRRRT